MFNKVRKLFSYVVIASLFVITSCSTLPAKSYHHSKIGYGVQSPHKIIERVMPSVVTIVAEIPQNERDNSQVNRFVKPGETLPKPQEEISPFQSGTGFVIKEDGTIVTNWHVVRNVIMHAESCLVSKRQCNEGTIHVEFSNDSMYEAKVFNYDKISDIALLKIVNVDDTKFPVVVWGEKPKLGGHAIVIGSPIGLDFSVSFGIVSAYDRIIPKAAPPFVPFIQTDAAMNRGNSGGPLFDATGGVIGINTLILTPQSNVDVGNVGLGFAIDGQYAQNIIKRLETGDKISWSYVGLHYRLLSLEETKENNLEFGSNVIIVKVMPNGTANNKLQENDIIKKLNGEIVTYKRFASMIARLESGTEITMEVLRNGTILDIDIVLGTRPSGY